MPVFKEINIPEIGNEISKKFSKTKDMISYLSEEEQVELALYLLFKNKNKANNLLNKRLPVNFNQYKQHPVKEVYLSKEEFTKRKNEMNQIVKNINYENVSSILNRKY